MQLKYVKLKPNDQDIPFLLELHKSPEISKYISIDEQNYFLYVTRTENVYYFKVLFESRLVAAVHMETQEDTLFFSIVTLPEYQNKGIGTQILKDIQSGQLVQNFSRIQVSIAKDNIPSRKLFEKAGFAFDRETDGLLEYCLVAKS